MKQLLAFLNLNSQSPIDHTIPEIANDPTVVPELIHRRAIQKDNMFLAIFGNESIVTDVYESEDLVVLCNSDLLGSGDCLDFAEARSNPAAYLARRYTLYGDSFAKDLHGWFGVVLYDVKNRCLKALVDHFGVRRLVYGFSSQSLAVASDLHLLQLFFPGPLEIDPVAVAEYMQYSCIPAPRTIYKNISKLEPAHVLSSSSGQSRAYWDMKYTEDRSKNENAWAKGTFEAIDHAVGVHSRVYGKDQHVGCFLSGGTDSSSVSGLTGRNTGRPAKTFSIGFDDARYNEIEYARIAASHFKTEHYEYFVTAQDILDLIPKAVSAFDEPFGNASIIPAYYCARLGCQHGVTHMLAGDGGDELFGGNQRYADDRIFQRYSIIPAWVRNALLEPGLELLPFRDKIRLLDRAYRYIRRAKIPLPDRWHSYAFLSSTPLERVFAPGFLQILNGVDTLAPARRHFTGAAAVNDLNRWLYHELKIIITDDDLRKVTSMTELAGVVPRYPLLDFNLAEFSGRVPANLKISGKRLRYIFKKAMSDFLPPEILAKTKHGFGLPYSVWLGEFKPLHDFTFDILRSKQSRERGYFHKDLVDKLWEGYKTDSATYYGDILWILLMIEYWFARHTGSAARMLYR